MLGQIHVELAGEAARAVGGDPGLGEHGLAALDVGDGQGEGGVWFQAVAGDIDVVADRALHFKHLGPGGRDGPQQQERGKEQRPDEPHRTSKAAWRGCWGAGWCGSASGAGEQARRTLARTRVAGKYGQPRPFRTSWQAWPPRLASVAGWRVLARTPGGVGHSAGHSASRHTASQGCTRWTGDPT